MMRINLKIAKKFTSCLIFLSQINWAQKKVTGLMDAKI